MKTEFTTYQTLPEGLKEIKGRAFSHSVFTTECEAMDAINYLLEKSRK